MFNQPNFTSPPAPITGKDVKSARSALRLITARHGARADMPSDRFAIRQVTGQRERLASEQLVRRMYAWRGYRCAAPDHRNGDAQRMTLAAWCDGELAATMTLTVDHGQGLLCETLYPREIAALRDGSKRLCEYSRFAIDPEFSSPKLLRAFFRSAYDLACHVLKATHAVIEVNPRHRRFYEQELGFRRLGAVHTCQRVEAPAQLLHCALDRPLPTMLRDAPPPTQISLADAA
ncbi:MAG: hypothetical protein LBV49_10785 [Azonexus sp.]|nr:hypothetical protein [Azonexus sp.]